jgi:hypothetical protein
MDSNDANNGLSRREVIGGIALLGLLGAVAVDRPQAAAQETTGNANYEALRRVLIERLINTRYYTGPDGSVYVLQRDEVWPGVAGGAYHADWLFNESTGLKRNPRAALEDTIVTETMHHGVPAGCDLSLVTQILDNAEALGLFDNIGLIYQVLREKINVETIGAHNYGVSLFRDWVANHPELSSEQRDTIDASAVAYLNVARPHDHHDFY